MITTPKYISFLKQNRTKEQAQEIYDQRIKDSKEIYSKFSDQFYIRDCPICGGSKFIDESKFKGQYGVAKCDTCASLYVNPSPNLEALNYYYNECECNKKFGSLLKKRFGKGVILSERSEYVMKLIETQLEKKNRIRVLEVGCNSGSFLHEIYELMKTRGISNSVELVGIDIDKSAIDSAISPNLNLFHSSAEEFIKAKHEKFDLVMHFELIEHLHNPFMFCKALNVLLSDQGLMYFHTPNAIGLDNQALSYNDFRPIAHGIFPPMHLNAFTTQNVGHFLIRAGFKVREITTPGNFDVDIICQFVEDDSPYSLLKNIRSENDLAIIQSLIRMVNGSSHLAVLSEK